MKTKYKILCILLMMLCLFINSSFKPSLKAQTEFEIEGTTLIKYNGTKAKVSIPSNVTIIGQGAFENNLQIVEVVLHNKVTQLEIRAFNGCTNLAKINLENVKKIGEMCFQGTSMTSVTLPSLLEIPIGLFAYAKVEEVIIPDGLGVIGDRAFFNCANLKKINLPESVIELGTEVFSGCTMLKELVLPPNLMKIGTKCFTLSGIEKINFPSSLQTIPNGACQECTSLKEVTISDGVKTIGGLAFAYCNLSTVFIPKSVTTLGDFVFYANQQLTKIEVDEASLSFVDDNGILYTSMYESLILIPINYPTKTVNLHLGVKKTEERCANELKNVTKVIIPEGLEMINHDAFEFSRKLEEVILPSSIKYINSGAFNGCSTLAKIDLPEGLLELSSSDYFKGVFSYCTSLSEVILPDSLLKLGPATFNACTNLTKVVIPSGLIDLGIYQFVDCPNLEEVVVKEGNTLCFTKDGVFYETRNGTPCLSIFPSKLQILEYTIIDGVTEILDFAFSSASYVKKVTIPSTVTSFGKGVFQSSTSIEEVIFENELQILPQYTFHHSTIKKVTFPKKLEIISDGAFVGCEALKTINLPNTLKQISGQAFSYSGLTSLVLPDSVVSIEQAFMYCYDLKEVTLSKNLKTIGRSCFRDTLIEEITIPESMVEVPIYAFTGCSELTKVYLPKTITYFNRTSFMDCNKLTDVIIDEANPYLFEVDGILYNQDYTELLFVNHSRVTSEVRIKDTVKLIPQKAFYNVSGIDVIYIPSSIETFEYRALHNASFTKVIFEEGRTEIPYNILNNCRNLKEVVFPETLERLDNSVFFGCISLESMIIPDGVDISNAGSLFEDCLNLKEVTLPKDATKIPQFMFSNCLALKEVNLPNTITGIETNAFKNCQSMNKIIIPSSCVSLEVDAFIDSGIKDIIILGDALTFIASSFSQTYFPKDVNIYYYNGASGFTSSSYRPYAKQLIKIGNETLTHLLTLNISLNDQTIILNCNGLNASKYDFYCNDKLISSQTSNICEISCEYGITYTFKVLAYIDDYLKEDYYVQTITKVYTLYKPDDIYILEYFNKLIEDVDLENASLEELSYIISVVESFDSSVKSEVLSNAKYQNLIELKLKMETKQQSLNALTYLKINNPNTYKVGETFTLNISSDGVLDQVAITYKITDPSVIKLNEEGKFVSLKEGMCRIYAQAENGVSTYLDIYITSNETSNLNIVIIITFVSISLCLIGGLIFYIIKRKKGVQA